MIQRALATDIETGCITGPQDDTTARSTALKSWDKLKVRITAAKYREQGDADLYME